MLLLQSVPTNPSTAVIVIMVLTALGVGAIILEVLRRYFSKKDQAKEGDTNLQIKLVDDRAILTSDLLKRLDAVEQKCVSLDARLEEKRKEFDVLFREHTELKGELSNLKQKFDDLTVRYTDLKKKYIELKHRYEGLSGETYDDDLEVL